MFYYKKYLFCEIIDHLGDYVVENEKHFLEDLINMHQRKMSCGGGDEAIHQEHGFTFLFLSRFLERIPMEHI